MINSESTVSKPKFSFRQWSLIILPFILIIFMWTVFVNLTAYFGLQEGYIFSYIIYWILWCFLIPAYVLKGFKNVFTLFQSVKPRFGDKPDITLFLLSWPIVFVVIFSIVPNSQKLHLITIPILLLSIALGFINGFFEEILWRGTYNKIYHENKWLGYIYPSFFFSLWHVCPISIIISRYKGDQNTFLLESLGLFLILGLSWGFYTWKTGSIRWSSIMHFIFDSLGLAGIFYASWFL